MKITKKYEKGISHFDIYEKLFSFRCMYARLTTAFNKWLNSPFSAVWQRYKGRFWQVKYEKAICSLLPCNLPPWRRLLSTFLSFRSEKTVDIFRKEARCLKACRSKCAHPSDDTYLRTSLIERHGIFSISL